MALSVEQKKIIGENTLSCSRNNRHRKQVQVYTKGKDNGKKVKGVLSGAYPEYKFYSAENTDANAAGRWLFGFLTLGIGNAAQEASQTWMNFTVEADSEEAASNLVKEINDCILKYGADSEYQQNNGGGNSGWGNASNPNSSNDDEETKTNWTTYIIIGLAAVAIILLVWPKPKK